MKIIRLTPTPEIRNLNHNPAKQPRAGHFWEHVIGVEEFLNEATAIPIQASLLACLRNILKHSYFKTESFHERLLAKWLNCRGVPNGPHQVLKKDAKTRLKLIHFQDLVGTVWNPCETNICQVECQTWHGKPAVRAFARLALSDGRYPTTS